MVDVNPPAGEDESILVNLDEQDDSQSQGGEDRGTTQVNAKPPPVPGPGSASPQTGLAELQRQITEERAERERVSAVARQIAQERDQAIAFAQEAERRGMSIYELNTENQIRAIEDKMTALAGAAEQAMHDGDFKRVAALNLESHRLGGDLAVARRDQQVLQQQREQMGEQPQQRPQQRQQAPAQPAAPTDPMERAIHGRTEATKAFIRKHPEIVRGDGTLKRNALDAHERALDEGFQVDTPGYFEYIERSIMAQVPQNGGQSPTHPTPSRAPTMAAPVARGGSVGGAGGGNTFTATPKMRRLAEEQGVPIGEWVRNYVRLLNEGRITPIT